MEIGKIAFYSKNITIKNLTTSPNKYKETFKKANKKNRDAQD